MRARFWSTFAAFDDAGLAAGLAELAAAHAHCEHVTFNDRLLIIIADKPAADEEAQPEGSDVRRAPLRGGQRAMRCCSVCAHLTCS